MERSLALFLLTAMPLSTAFSTGASSLAPTKFSSSESSHNTHQQIRHQSSSARRGWLQYRNGDEDTDGSKQQYATSGSRWWKSLLNQQQQAARPTSPTTDDDDTSQRVQEYLAFLDKRYHQIHDDDEPTAQPQQQPAPLVSDKTLSAQIMRWLNKEESQAASASRSDALYALGLAARAGEASLAQQQPAQGGAAAAAAVVEEHNSFRAMVLAWKQSPAYTRIANARQGLLRFEALKARQALLAVATAIRRAPATLWRASGGKRPLLVATGVLSVVLLHILLPAITSFVRESVASQA